MRRLLRTLAVAIIGLGLVLPYSYSAAGDTAAVEAMASNPAVDAAVNQAAEVIRAKRAKLAKKQAARKRAIRKITTPAYGHITASFGSRSSHWSTRHTGMDIDANYGDSVRNMMSGKVIFAGWGGAYGNLVVIRTFRGGDVWYAHMSKILVKDGEKIPSGQRIGRVGSTGNSTGTHLHIEVRKNDYPVNPAMFLWGKNRGKIGKMKIPSWAYGSRVEHLGDL